MASDTTVTSLTATGGVGQITLIALWAAPSGKGCLSYMQPEVIEFWRSATNNRANATMIAETATGQYTDNNIDGTFYYWARVRDNAENNGPFYPTSATNGVSASTNIDPVQGPLDDLSDTLTTAINIEEQERKNIDYALALSINQVSVKADSAIAEGLIQNKAYAGPTGWGVSISHEARVEVGDAWAAAGWYVDAKVVEISPGVFETQSRLRLVAEQVLIEDNAGNILALFSSNGNLQEARIPNISANKIKAGTISATISIMGPIITGGLIRTKAVGERVEISETSNNISVFNSSGTMIASFGGYTSLTPKLAIYSGIGIVVDTATTQPANQFKNTGGEVAILAEASNGSTAHGIRAKNIAAGGGSGLVGTPSNGGGYAFYAETGGYGPFTGQHSGLLPKDDAAVPGDILVDTRVLKRRGIDDTLTEIAVSTLEKQRNIIGVLSSRRDYEAGALLNVNGIGPKTGQKYADQYDLVTINGLGEGQINVCGMGGDIEAGDFICTSAMTGKGQRQNGPDGNADDVLRRCTVARAREAVRFSSPEQVKMIACIYVSG